ncbi:MAG: hypothetical protein WA814_06050, partial [Candidatus Baltobacteraceae bacterium]
MVLITTAPSRAATDPQAAQLIASSGKALGIASLGPVTTIRLDGTVTGLGLTGTQTQYVNVRDGRFAETTNLGPLVSLDGYDGTVTWNADGTHLVWNVGGDSPRASEINQAYLTAYGLWAPQALGADVTSLGTKSDGGKTYEGVRITPVGSKVPFDLWFDPATHLPVRADFVNGFTTAAVTFSDYRSVQGLMVPYNQRTDSSDGNNTVT